MRQSNDSWQYGSEDAKCEQEPSKMPELLVDCWKHLLSTDVVDIYSLGYAITRTGALEMKSKRFQRRRGRAILFHNRNGWYSMGRMNTLTRLWFEIFTLSCHQYTQLISRILRRLLPYISFRQWHQLLSCRIMPADRGEWKRSIKIKTIGTCLENKGCTQKG